MPETLLTRLLNGAAAVLPGANNIPSAVPPIQSFQDWPRYYQLLMDYYENTSLYDEVTSESRRLGTWTGPIKGLRSPSRRIVEFYVKHVWPGELDTALPITGASASTKKCVEQIWDWSNWQIKKQQYIRQLAIFGDSFLKIVQPEGSEHIIFQQIDPRLVTEVKADDRGFVTYIRLDSNLTRTKPDGDFVNYIRTEIWDKAAQEMWIYEYPASQYDLTKMRPLESHNFDEFGIDFIPFVWTMFTDVGNPRGVGAYSLILDKIDELNRACTRLHQILFRYNRPMMALSAAGADLTGRPLPPVRLQGREVTGGDSDAAYIGEDDLLTLPAGADIQLLVPQLDYGSALEIVVAMLKEIESDNPELMYFRLSEMGDTSGRSIRHFLGPAIKSVEEVRANAEAGLIRAIQMAMTIGKAAQIFPATIGSFETGDFAVKFVPREVIPISEVDQAIMDQDQGQAGTYWLQIGIDPKVIAERLGFKKSDVLDKPPPAILNPAMPTNTPQPGAGGPNDPNKKNPDAPPAAPGGATAK